MDLDPFLLNLYSASILQKLQRRMDYGYVDDIVLIADNMKYLQDLLNVTGNRSKY